MAWRCGAPRAARDAVRKPWEAAVPVARANRRSASGSLDDAPHRLRLPSCPADRPRDLYGSISRTFGINPGITCWWTKRPIRPMSPSRTWRPRKPRGESRTRLPRGCLVNSMASATNYVSRLTKGKRGQKTGTVYHFLWGAGCCRARQAGSKMVYCPGLSYQVGFVQWERVKTLLP